VRSATKVACVALAVLALLVALPLAYSTAHGYMIWWIRSSGSVRIDGVSNGYLHKDWSGKAWIVTRTDSRPRQSYLVSLYGSKHVAYCGDWHAPRFPVFPFGDVNQPCLGLFTGSEIRKTDLPNSSTLSIGSSIIEFYTMGGKRVTVSW